MGNPIKPPRPRPRRPQSPPEPKEILSPNKTPTNVVMGPRGPKKMKGGGMTKGYARGGIKMGDGGSLKMVEKDGKKVPFFAADGEGKMATGGMATKGGMKGGGMATKGNTKGGAKKKTTGKSKVRGAGIAKRGVRPAKMR